MMNENTMTSFAFFETVRWNWEGSRWLDGEGKPISLKEQAKLMGFQVERVLERGL